MPVERYMSDERIRAVGERLADPGVLDSMVKLRNSFAHPKEFNTIWSPGMAVTIFQSTIEVVNRLWPLDVGSDGPDLR